MGNAPSEINVEIKPSVSAPLPNFMTLQTESLEQYFSSAEQLYEELCENLQKEYRRDPNLKSSELTMWSDMFFRVTKTIDMAAMAPNPETVPPNTFLTTNIHYTCNAKRLEILEEYWHATLPVLEHINIIRVLRDPVRLEGWNQDIREELRDSGPNVQESAKTILNNVFGREVEVFADVPSLSLARVGLGHLGLKSVMSQPLHDLTDAEDLFDGILKQVQSQAYSKFVKEVKDVDTLYEDDDAWNFDVNCLLSDPGGSATPDLGANLTVKVRALKKERYFSMLLMRGDLFIENLGFTIIHTDPLCVECWVRHPILPMSKPAMVAWLLKNYAEICIQTVKEK